MSKIVCHARQLLLRDPQAQTALCQIMIYDTKFSTEVNLTRNYIIYVFFPKFFPMEYKLLAISACFR